MADTTQQFAGRTVFITGVARGQGRAHALRLATEGAAIIGVDLCADVGTVGYPPATPDDLETTIAEVEAAGGQIVARVADVRDQSGLDTVLAEGTEAFGRLDGVIANAGICSYGRLWELSDEQWQSVIDTNLTGVFHTLRATVPLLLDHDTDTSDGHGASVVITTSGAGIKPLPLLSHYSASKAGVIAMARSLAHEVAAHHVRVNVVAPTAVKTPMGKDATLREVIAAHPEATAAFGNLLPIGSVDAEDITEAVTWLLSDAARYVTGVVLPVDAGTTIR